MPWRTGGLLLAVLVIVALPYMITRGSSKESFQAGELVKIGRASCRERVFLSV